MSRPYKEVYLEYRSHPYTVTLQAFEQIKAIIEHSLVCSFCCNGYTQENPMVAVNCCFSCYLKEKQAHNQLPEGFRLLAEVKTEDLDKDYKTYTCQDVKGYIYLLHTTRPISDRVDAYIGITLKYYGYRLPETYPLKDGTVVELQDAWLKIYGDFRTSPVVLATYHESYSNHISTAFLLYRDQQPLEFSKRKNPVRQWYLDEKAAIEATWQDHVGYIVGTGADGEDRTAYQLYDHHLYPGIVARARLTYEQQKGVI